jgi:iron complex transport system substrate-binding protein
LNSSIEDYIHLKSTFSHPPVRVVSLVPSLTESLFDLGFGNSVVGITDYCIHPGDKLQGLARIGGPKTPRIQDILALNADLVVANQEENTPAAINDLREAGVNVWVSFPKTIREAVDVLWVMAGIYQSKMAALRLEILEHSLDWATAAGSERQHDIRYFCPIWQDVTSDGSPWWMTFNRFTYMHDLLEKLGGINIFSNRERVEPLEADLGKPQPGNSDERDTRYPRVSMEEVRAANPELILLPDDPYKFGEEHQKAFYQWFDQCAAAKEGKIILVDGSLITWYGTRLARALEILPSLLV